MNYITSAIRISVIVSHVLLEKKKQKKRKVQKSEQSTTNFRMLIKSYFLIISLFTF